MSPRTRYASASAAVSVLSSAWALYSWYRFQGWFAALARFELNRFGQYFPVPTLLATWLSLVAVGLCAALLLLHMVRTPEPKGAAPQDRPVPWPRIAGLSIAALSIAAGGYLLIRGATAGPLTELDVSELYRGVPPKSRYVHLVNVYGVRGVTVEQEGNRHVYTLAAPSTGLAATEVKLLVDADEATLQQQMGPEGAAAGLLDRGVRGDVRWGMEHSKVKLADDAWTVEVGKSPRDEWMLGAKVLGSGLLTAAVVALALSMVMKRVRRNPR